MIPELIFISFIDTKSPEPLNTLLFSVRHPSEPPVLCVIILFAIYVFESFAVKL